MTERGRTLGARLIDRDRDRFVGRKSELALLERCLSGDPSVSVVLIHGPGGIGKSTLLRELGRRAPERGYELFFVEGRELAPMPDALEAVLSGARGSARPLVLIDTYERMTALDGYLRRGLLPSLPDSAVVVIAGRLEPDPAWFSGGWEGVATALELRALSPGDALGLLAAHGLHDERAPAVIEWAEGSPLALALAAETAAVDTDWTPELGAERPEIVRSLIRRVARSELGGARLSALGVAAIARVTTVDLLRNVLPEADAEIEYDRLRSLTFTEPLGDGLTLHELVRKALRADLRHRDQERERELRRRIIDHLYERARRGDPLLAIDMAHLIDNAAIKWGFGWEGSVEYRIDDVRPGDTERVAELFDPHNFRGWWRWTKRFFDEAPERVAIARDKHDRLCGFTVSMSPANAPEFAREDPLSGPRLAHARADGQLGGAVLWRDSIDFTRERRGRVQAMLGMAGILRSGVVNPRFAYLPINPTNPDALTFARTLGAEHLPELDLDLEGRRIECHRIDYGPGGLFAAQRAVVYRELGLAPPIPARARRAPAPDTVREALRNFRVPHELARNRLATGQTPEERAESVRALLRDAAERAFGDSENEKLLRRVLIRGYLEPAPSHEQAAIDLSLSRAAYFRRLRAAAERVAEYLSARP
ncbi:MAG: ATP-binding protein [Actinomycetota bacterium]|nr:ATP-binding protein [Actinomycetota bacterium]